MNRILLSCLCLSVFSLLLSGCGRHQSSMMNQASNPYIAHQQTVLNPALNPAMVPQIYSAIPAGAKRTPSPGDRAIATPNGYVFMSEITSPGAQQYNCASPQQRAGSSISQGMQNPCTGSGTAQQATYGTQVPTTP